MQNQEGLSPIQLFFHNKWVRLALVFDIILLAILILLLVWQSTKVSTISFDVTPLNSIISINGDNHYRNGSYSITPGTYEIAISHDGLNTKTFKVDIAPQHIVSLTTFLTDNNNFDFYKLRDNYMSYKKLSEIASANNNITTDHDASAEEFVKKFNQQYRLLTTSLPIEYASYDHDIDGWDSLKTQFFIVQPQEKNLCAKTLCVQALIGSNDEKDLVNKTLIENGFDVNELEILYEID